MHQFKVVVVDDDQFIRRIAQMALTRVANWQVVLANSGAQALQLLAEEKPDLILLDVMMPVMDGPTFLHRLRESSGAAQHIPVIFMTAKVQQHEINQYLLMDAAGVISKPFDPISLPQEIRNILNRTLVVQGAFA